MKSTMIYMCIQKISLITSNDIIIIILINPLPDDKILDWSKLKQIADDILKCI